METHVQSLLFDGYQAMTIDQAGIDFIKLWEGFESHPYMDVAGKATVGIGHLIKPSEDFSSGVTLSQAESLLYDDLEAPEEALQRLVPADCTQNQWNALASFAFNLGVGSLETMLAHGWPEVPQQILRWDRAGGQQVPGLTRRRKAEAALFHS
jgi:lysozyme